MQELIHQHLVRAELRMKKQAYLVQHWQSGVLEAPSISSILHYASSTPRAEFQVLWDLPGQGSCGLGGLPVEVIIVFPAEVGRWL